MTSSNIIKYYVPLNLISKNISLRTIYNNSVYYTEDEVYTLSFINKKDFGICDKVVKNKNAPSSNNNHIFVTEYYNNLELNKLMMSKEKKYLYDLYD